MPVDGYTLAAALLLMALFATVRVALGPRAEKVGNPLLRALTHPYWLIPLIVAVNFCIGLYFTGALSPWPPAAFADFSARSGFWAGSCALLAALITDIWLLWAPTQVLRRFAAPERRHAFKYFPLFNALVGATVIALALHR
jgi:hypothetical protein